MICIWSSWCHCHPIVSCIIKIQDGLTFLVSAYPGCPGNEAVKWVYDRAKTIRKVMAAAAVFWLLVPGDINGDAVDSSKR